MRSSQPEHISAVIARWLQRSEEWGRLGVTVDGGKLASEVVEDLRGLEVATADDMLTLTQAAEVTGYTDDHLGRLVREGKLTNYGEKHSPRVKRSELPMKPARTMPRSDIALCSRGPTLSAITRAAVASKRERARR